MYGVMNVWMDGWTDRWMGGGRKGWVVEWMDAQPSCHDCIPG